jgi:hypothetical protein
MMGKNNFENIILVIRLLRNKNIVYFIQSFYVVKNVKKKVMR